MKLIDATRPETFPLELTEIVMAHLSALPDSTIQNFRAHRIENNTDVLCAIEKYFGPMSSSGYDMYQNELIPIFAHYDLLCFHVTRLGSTEDILHNGLFIQEKKYEDYLSTFLRSKGVEEARVELALDAIRKEYARKRRDLPREICFFLNYTSLHEENGAAGYDQFYDTVGGELANWALVSRMPDVLSVLQTNGIPVVIKFRIPFSQVSSYHKDSVIYQFVACVIARALWDYNYVIEADGATNVEVPPNDIIEVFNV